MPEPPGPDRHDLTRAVKQVLLVQGITALAVLIAFLTHSVLGEPENMAGRLAAVCFGSMLALTGTLISARSARSSSHAAATGSNMAMVTIFSGLVLKLVIMGGGIAVGLVVLSIDALPLLAAFAAVKISSVFAVLAYPATKD